jgi:nucleoside-diphosphate kinase
MAVERTLNLVKPDGVCKQLVGTVIERFEQGGLKLAGMKMVRLSRADAERFYAEHKERPFYPGLINFMISAPIIAAVWEGEGAIQKARALMGSTNSTEAQPGTLRRQFGVDNRYNLVHGSDSPTSAEREIRFFFQPEELFSYTTDAWRDSDVKGQNDGESKKASQRLSAR